MKVRLSNISVDNSGKTFSGIIHVASTDTKKVMDHLLTLEQKGELAFRNDSLNEYKQIGDHTITSWH